MLPAGLKIGASEKRRKQKKLKRANRIEYCNSFAVSMKTVWNYFKFDFFFFSNCDRNMLGPGNSETFKINSEVRFSVLGFLYSMKM